MLPQLKLILEIAALLIGLFVAWWNLKKTKWESRKTKAEFLKANSV